MLVFDLSVDLIFLASVDSCECYVCWMENGARDYM
jgi:hypothetical protein